MKNTKTVVQSETCSIIFTTDSVTNEVTEQVVHTAIERSDPYTDRALYILCCTAKVEGWVVVPHDDGDHLVKDDQHYLLNEEQALMFSRL